MEFLAGVLFGVFVLTLAAAMVVGMIVRDRRERDEVSAWKAYARREGLRWVPSRAEHVLAYLEGRHQGLPFALEVCKIEGGSRTVTRASARASDPADVTLLAWCGAMRPDAGSAAPFRSGDPGFDGVFEARAADPAAASRHLSTRLRVALQRFPTPLVGGGLAFAYQAGAATVAWPGGEINVSQIRAALDILAAACPFTARALQQMN